jgi:hypothetical protein
MAKKFLIACSGSIPYRIGSNEACVEQPRDRSLDLCAIQHLRLEFIFHKECKSIARAGYDVTFAGGASFVQLGSVGNYRNSVSYPLA